MSSLHREAHFEAEICQHLGANGWLYAEEAASGFDTASGLYRPDLQAWLQASQPESLQRLEKTHGAQLPQVLAERIRKSLNERGTLEVLRRGVDMLGLKEPLQLAQFKPALGLNPAIQARYEANQLRVLRQVHHSPNHPKEAVDLVLSDDPLARQSAVEEAVGEAVKARGRSTAGRPGQRGGKRRRG